MALSPDSHVTGHFYLATTGHFLVAMTSPAPDYPIAEKEGKSQ
jgi:hypothetical protein